MGRSSNPEYAPVYQIDPPDYLEQWHDSPKHSALQLYQGPYGSTVTLPRTLEKSLRVFTTPREHRTKQSAHKHAAFGAYLALYQAGLLDQYLLPMYRADGPVLDAEVRQVLRDVERRAGTVNALAQINPWIPLQAEGGSWYTT